jgi:hypothetical protein
MTKEGETREVPQGPGPSVEAESGRVGEKPGLAGSHVVTPAPLRSCGMALTSRSWPSNRARQGEGADANRPHQRQNETAMAVVRVRTTSTVILQSTAINRLLVAGKLRRPPGRRPNHPAPTTGSRHPDGRTDRRTGPANDPGGTAPLKNFRGTAPAARGPRSPLGVRYRVGPHPAFATVRHQGHVRRRCVTGSTRLGTQVLEQGGKHPYPQQIGGGKDNSMNAGPTYQEDKRRQQQVLLGENCRTEAECVSSKSARGQREKTTAMCAINIKTPRKEGELAGRQAEPTLGSLSIRGISAAWPGRTSRQPLRMGIKGSGHGG